MSWSERYRMVTRTCTAMPSLLRGRVHPDRLLDRNAKRYPEAIGIAYANQRYTWREIRARTDQYARFFTRQGIRPGDNVSLMLDNRPEFLFLFQGLQRIGAVAALINTNLSGAPLAHVIRIADARLHIFGNEHARHLPGLSDAVTKLDLEKNVFIQHESQEDEFSGAPSLNAGVEAEAEDLLSPVPFNGTDHCAYIYTSGTTGLPKAAIMSHLRLTGTGHMAAHVLHRVSRGELIYVALPLYHSNALMLGWFAALASGAGVALRRKFSARNFFSDIRSFDAVSFVYIGELCRYLLNSPVQKAEREHNLRSCTGNGLRPDIWRPFQDRFGIPRIREIYGATEGTATLANLAGRPGMVGRILPPMKLLRCDPESGEVIRGESGLCQLASVGETGLLVGPISRLVPYDGYLDRKASERKVLCDVLRSGDRYFNSGDLLKRHEGRWLSFVDRVGDTFRWKGENVSTNEVAELINAAAGIIETNVYGVEITGCEGRAGMAAIRTEEGFDPTELARYVVEQMPNYQRPLFLRIIRGEMDVTGTFKHQKVGPRAQGFDPNQIEEPLYYLAGGEYQPLTPEIFKAIEEGEIRPG